MKIAHISDIHIRNLKFHSDYRKVFEDFYRKLDELQPHLVVNTGDTAHAKTNISPEFVSMTSEFFTEVAKRCPIINVLGNHDLNLMNEDRQDAITPIIEALDNPNIALWKKSGLYVPKSLSLFEKIGGIDVPNFWNFGIADPENWPRPPYDKQRINIGLFHGSIRGCLTDSLFRMTQVEYDQTIFDGLDFVLMGDIHKRQSFKDGRIWYAGSMIQQNFGEDPDKGFLLWEVKGKDDYLIDFHELRGNRRFYTVSLDEKLAFPDAEIPADSRLRIVPPRSLTLVEQKAVERLARKKYSPHDIITLSAQNIGQKTAEIVEGTEKIENIRKLDTQERLLKEFAKGVDQKIMDRMLDFNRRYHIAVEQKDDIARGVSWRILKMGWNNLYNYGEGNVIDFSQVKGLTGIFAPNASGKSGLVDVITIGMFDSNTKEVPKNIHLINDNKDNAAAIIELVANGERFNITRSIERVKYGQKKGNEREWGKTSLDLMRYDGDGVAESLNGELRPQTEATIRKHFGTFDDFMLTSLFAQWDPMDIIMCKETDRKRILFKFLDLDIFDDKLKMAKDEAREWMKRLEEMEEGDYESAYERLKEKIEETRKQVQADEDFLNDYSIHATHLQTQIEKLLEEKSTVPQVEWKLSEQQGHEKLALSNMELIQQKIEEHHAVIDVNKKTLRAQIEIRDNLVGKFDENSHEKFIQINERKSVISARVKELEQKVGNFTRQASLLEKVPCGDQFPTCQFLLDAFKAKGSLPMIEKELESAIDDGKITEKLWWEAKYEDHARFTFEQHQNAIEAINNTIRQNQVQIEKLQAQHDVENGFRWNAKERIAAIEKAAADVLRNDAIEERLSITRLNRREIERMVLNRRDELSRHTKELGLLDGQMAVLSKSLAQITEVREVCTAYEKFMEAMGKDGIALQILTQKLPLINQEINRILSQAAEFGAHIEYDREEQSIRLYIKYGTYKSRLLELGSGAEKFLASVAIRSALLSISNLPRSNLFIIDEGFGKLDSTNLEAVQRMFDYLKSVFDHVIVISHLDIMKDMVDNIIEITQDDEGYAHVEIGG